MLAKDNDEKIILYLATFSGNVQILERIWKWAKEQLTSEELYKLLLTQGYIRQTAWHVEAKRSKLEILDNLWEWTKKVVNTDELNNKLLLAKENDDKNSLVPRIIYWHYTDISENMDVS